MKNFVKKLTLPLVMSGMLLQTGCIVGAVTGNLPLALVGAGIAVGGPVVGNYYPARGLERLLPLFIGGIVGAGGVILNSENPGRQLALNPIPLDKTNAQNLGVSISDLENYNDMDLSNVLETNRLIESAIVDLQKGSSTDEVLNRLAPELGMKDGKNLIKVVKGDALEASQVKAFAEARDISEKSAEIYLKSRFSIKVK